MCLESNSKDHEVLLTSSRCTALHYIRIYVRNATVPIYVESLAIGAMPCLSALNKRYFNH